MKLRAENGETCRLPFASKAFDVVNLNYVGKNLKELQATFAEWARILRPGGRLVVVTSHALGYFVRLSRLACRLFSESFIRKFICLREYRSSEDIFPTFYRANTREDILRQMERAGLTDESLQMLRDPAVFSFIAPLAASELLVMCLLAQFQELVEGTMIGVYRRFPAHVTCTGHDAKILARTAGSGQVGLR